MAKAGSWTQTSSPTFWVQANETAEQRRERRRQQAADRARREAEAEARRLRRIEEAAERDAADRRAWDLLLSLMSDDQFAEFEEHRHFTVVGSLGTRYRIESDRIAGNVVSLDTEGVPLVRYCCHVYANDVQGRYLAIADNMLTQKLALEFQEDEFLRRANATDLRVGQGGNIRTIGMAA